MYLTKVSEAVMLLFIEKVFHRAEITDYGTEFSK